MKSNVCSADQLIASAVAAEEEGAAFHVPKPELPDEGFYTSDDWRKTWQCSLSHAMAKLARMEAAGEMERRIFRIQKPHRIYPVPHYARRKA